MCGGRPSIATEHASADSPAGKMVAAGRHRRLQLPPGGDKQLDTDRVPIPRDQSLPAHATAAEPERLDDLGADQAVGRRLAPATANPSSVAREALRRQTPKVGAVCPNWARTDLCGGREVTRVPTAIDICSHRVLLSLTHFGHRPFAQLPMSELPPSPLDC